jgi:4,5-dihydroxyphthalate decarboxylase
MEELAQIKQKDMEKDGKLKIVGKYAWADKHGVPINHMLVIRSELSRTRPDLVREVFRIFKESRDIAIRGGNKNAAQLNYGVEANRPSLEAIINFVFDQKLIPRRYSVEELFDDTTRSLV